GRLRAGSAGAGARPRGRPRGAADASRPGGGPGARARAPLRAGGREAPAGRDDEPRPRRAARAGAEIEQRERRDRGLRRGGAGVPREEGAGLPEPIGGFGGVVGGGAGVLGAVGGGGGIPPPRSNRRPAAPQRGQKRGFQGAQPPDVSVVCWTFSYVRGASPPETPLLRALRRARRSSALPHGLRALRDPAVARQRAAGGRHEVHAAREREVAHAHRGRHADDVGGEDARRARDRGAGAADARRGGG